MDIVLSPYHNPPYKTPTPKSSISPPPSRSPKRKRNDSAAPVQVDNESAPGTDNPVGSQSPPMKVTERFKDLDLRQAKTNGLRTNAPRALPRKRLKRTPTSGDKTSGSERFDDRKLEQEDQSKSKEQPEPSNEIVEAPDCHLKNRPSPPSSPKPSDPPNDVPPVPVITTEDRSSTPPQLPSTPSTPNRLSPQVIVDRAVSPLPSREELTPDQAALTWQEDEITGHDIDPSGDDDGEGINGIGFRPTAAIAEARQQRRRQQVNEWKAREAKEARQRRMDRRRGGGGGGRYESGGTAFDDQNADDVAARRMVRFEGVGL